MHTLHVTFKCLHLFCRKHASCSCLDQRNCQIKTKTHPGWVYLREVLKMILKPNIFRMLLNRLLSSWEEVEDLIFLSASFSSSLPLSALGSGVKEQRGEDSPGRGPSLRWWDVMWTGMLDRCQHPKACYCRDSTGMMIRMFPSLKWLMSPCPHFY